MKQWPNHPQQKMRQEWREVDTTSLGAYMRQGGKIGMASAVGVESVLVVFFIISRAALVLIGFDGVDEIFGCLTIFFGAIFAEIGYGVGAIGRMIAWNMNR